MAETTIGTAGTIGSPYDPYDTFEESDVPDNGDALAPDEVIIEETFGEDWNMQISTDDGSVADGYLLADCTLPTGSHRPGRKVRIPHLRHYTPPRLRYRVRKTKPAPVVSA